MVILYICYIVETCRTLLESSSYKQLYSTCQLQHRGDGSIGLLEMAVLIFMRVLLNILVDLGEKAQTLVGVFVWYIIDRQLFNHHYVLVVRTDKGTDIHVHLSLLLCVCVLCRIPSSYFSLDFIQNQNYISLVHQIHTFRIKSVSHSVNNKNTYIQIQSLQEAKTHISNMIYKVKITGHQIQDDKVVYIIHVSEEPPGMSTIFRYRYSQLRDIHQALEKLIKKFKLSLILPEFPGRKIFGATNKSEEAVLERKKQLTSYLSELLLLEKLYSLQLYRTSFLPFEETAKELTKPEKQESRQLSIEMCIDRYSMVDDIVIYYVRLRNIKSNEEWTFKSRYSDLKNVHEALKQSKVRCLPNFPKRKIMGITNQSPQDIEKRWQELERYFNEIFSTKELANDEIVRFFVEDSRKQAQREALLEKVRKQKREKKLTM